MTLSATSAGFFTDEWTRFRDGVRQLNPDQWRLYQEAIGRKQRAVGEARTITVPGWEDIIKLGPRYETTRAERDAFYAEKRGGPAAQISDEARRSILAQRAIMERMRTSATPEFALGMGQILTAIDNVQDLLSSLATFGRLALWAGARAGLRAIPGLGWVVLAGDLLNYLGMLGLLSTPIFGLLCKGPTQALAAGLPTWMMRCTLRQEAWKLAHGGPFGRKARATRLLNTRGRLPGAGNLWEVAQTTEQLWGYGASFGGLVGLMTESTGALFAFNEGESVRLSTEESTRQWNRLLWPIWKSQSAGERAMQLQAARIAATAPGIARTQDHFTEDEHTEVLAGHLVALGQLQQLWAGLDVESAIEQALDHEWTVPVQLRAETRELLEQLPTAAQNSNPWVLPGSPIRVTGADYVAAHVPLIAQATLDYLGPRRNRPEIAFYGGLIVEATEAAWLLATQDRQALRYERGDDACLGISLADSGFLLSPEQGEAVLWPFWLAARAAITDTGRRTLYPADWRRLAAAHGVTLIKNLGPEGTWPPEWTTA